MKKTSSIILFFVLVILLFSAWWGIEYFQPFQKSPVDSSRTVILNETEFSTTQKPSKKTEVEYTIEAVAENLFVPWSIVFTSPSRMLVSERSGAVRIVEHDLLQSEPLYTFSEVSTEGEEGLMGLALDPEYDSNHFMYACLAYPKQDVLVDKIVRLTDNGDSLSDPTTILDDIPAAQYHAGCRIGFGPDNKLYITTGEATQKEIAQDLMSLGGKILRINSDGTIPQDNPFPNSPVWSYGHRNPQGIAWHPVTKKLYSSEHGPSLFDGPAGGDEINLIEPGKNYGWPLVSHEETKEGTEPPLLLFTPAMAPASALFYNSDVLPQFQNNFFFGALKGEGIIRVVFSQDDPREVVFYERVEGVNVGRVRDVVQGPDGFIYFSSSNRDDRGELQEKDDKIYRLRPVE